MTRNRRQLGKYNAQKKNNNMDILGYWKKNGLT